MNLSGGLAMPYLNSLENWRFGQPSAAHAGQPFDSINESARSLRRLRVVRRVTDREGLQVFRAVGPASFHLAYQAPVPRDFGSGMGIDDPHAVFRRVSPRSYVDRGS